ncbi:TPA: hypothetical protein N0F65_004761 [Lagenidium giganteum]|uniref:Sugar transporter SWEET1 n=1 Tax=Lagenidium giganteum TaxID=4803 RepID=A0AAV2YQ65_9STRA|nr:TPA: hypothetical protein N0F65_004761 [Lagenidium giganteum]
MASLQSLQNMLYMSTFLAAKSVPVIAAGTSIVFAVSPWTTVRTIARARSTLQFSFAPFYFYFVQSVIFGLYAYATSNVLMGATTAFGSMLDLHYVLVYYRHATDKTQPFRLLTIATACILFLWVHTAGKSPDDAKVIIGVPGNILSVLTSASPLLQVKTIIQRRDASSLPFGMSVMNVVSGGVWMIYGIMLRDILVIFPNGFAFVMGIIQVALIMAFRAPKAAPSIPIATMRFMSKSVHEKV